MQTAPYVIPQRSMSIFCYTWVLERGPTSIDFRTVRNQIIRHHHDSHHRNTTKLEPWEDGQPQE